MASECFQDAQPTNAYREPELPLLGGLAALLRWLEELANLISGPMLALGLGISLVDLLTDGKLITTIPVLLYAWAISQAVGVDTQLVANWDKARLSLRAHDWAGVFGHTPTHVTRGYLVIIDARRYGIQLNTVSVTEARGVLSKSRELDGIPSTMSYGVISRSRSVCF